MQDDVDYDPNERTESWQRGYECGIRTAEGEGISGKGSKMICEKCGNKWFVHDGPTAWRCSMCGRILNSRPQDEISELDMDLLTVLSRIYQARHLIERIDPQAEKILTHDAPRLAGHVTVPGMAWCERTDLDTGFTEWLREIAS